MLIAFLISFVFFLFYTRPKTPCFEQLPCINDKILFNSLRVKIVLVKTLLESNFTNITKTIIFGHVGERRPFVND